MYDRSLSTYGLMLAFITHHFSFLFFLSFSDLVFHTIQLRIGRRYLSGQIPGTYLVDGELGTKANPGLATYRPTQVDEEGIKLHVETHEYLPESFTTQAKRKLIFVSDSFIIWRGLFREKGSREIISLKKKRANFLFWTKASLLRRYSVYHSISGICMQGVR